MQQDVLPVMICFARSGGTLLNRCLGAMDVVVLSEVNPIGPRSTATVRSQAAEWFDTELEPQEFAPAVAALYAQCRAQQRPMLVRDWSYVNFTPTKGNGYEHSYQLSIL